MIEDKKEDLEDRIQYHINECKIILDKTSIEFNNHFLDLVKLSNLYYRTYKEFYKTKEE